MRARRWPQRLVRFLDERGFRLNGVYNVHYGPRGRAIQADMLFSNEPANTH